MSHCPNEAVMGYIRSSPWESLTSLQWIFLVNQNWQDNRALSNVVIQLPYYLKKKGDTIPPSHGCMTVPLPHNMRFPSFLGTNAKEPDDGCIAPHDNEIWFHRECWSLFLSCVCQPYHHHLINKASRNTILPDSACFEWQSMVWGIILLLLSYSVYTRQSWWEVDESSLLSNFIFFSH